MNAHVIAGIKRFMKTHRIPGMAGCLILNGSPVFSGGFGVQSLDSQIPMTEKSVFHLASVTKPFVATAVLQLAEKGLMDLDTPIVSYLPYFRLNDPRYEKITSRHILSHVSGMRDFDSNPWARPRYDDPALEEFVTGFVAEKFLDRDPGTAYEYSNTLYEVMGDVIAKVSGQVFEDYIQDRILDPLDMHLSTMYRKKVDKGRLVHGHVLREEQVRVSEVFPYNRMHAPSSTMYSSALDMGKWIRVNLAAMTGRPQTLLRPRSCDPLWRPYSDTIDNVALSWHLEDHNGTGLVFHSGSDVGFNTFLYLIPEKQTGLFLASNLGCPLKALSGELIRNCLSLGTYNER